MTSGHFIAVDPDSITINRDARQRRVIDDIDILADSMDRLGQIHPIVIDRDYNLIAGERRLTAAKKLGWQRINAQFEDTLDPKTRLAIELEENVKRKDIPWQDQCTAVLDYHELRSADPEWKQEDTASALGLSPASVSQQLKIAQEIRGGNTLVATADRMSKARNIVTRAEERKQAAVKSSILAKVAGPVPDKPKLILNASFHDWQLDYSGPKFNLIHCDFPYGIGMDKSDQGGGGSHGYYEDNFETYVELLGTLEQAMSNVIEESAHLIFWFSMKHYTYTLTRLRSFGWRIDDFPFIWHRSDNAGILPDPNRGPRRTYETAFFGSRGDRKIVKAVANSFSGPTVRERHMSEKPQPMLEHFFRMLVDEHTTLLDPTAGSGSALRAGRALGANRLLGLEINPEFADRANQTLGA